MIQPKPRVIAILLLSFVAAGNARPEASPKGAPARASNWIPWTFRADFSQGISGWMGYPLSQDVGYDPSIYTLEEGGSKVLVRDVISHGERLLRVGLVRPLSFHADPSSSFHIAYDFESCGSIRSMRIIFGTPDGQRYSRSLSLLSGTHDLQMGGHELEIPLEGADIDVIVLEAEVAAPGYGSHTRLTLHTLEIQSERPPRLEVRVPNLERSTVDDVAVAREIVTAGNSWKIDVGPGSAARLDIYDDLGELRGSAKLPAGGTAGTQVTAPDKPGFYRAEVSGRPARAEFRLLVLGKVPAHPRVLLTAGRLTQLRSESYSNELLAIIHRRASELRNSLAYNPRAGQNILLLPTFIIHSGIPEYFALMESYSNAISFNALDFRISGDRQALEAARRALLTVSAWPTWTPPWFNAKGIHTYYEVGGFTQKVALGYDLIADELSRDEKFTIADALWRLSIRPTLDDYFFFDRLPIAPSNHESQSVGGAIEACVALYGDVPDWPARFGPALAELVSVYERMLAGLFPGDGSEAEPAGYENFAMEGLSWGMAALHALDVRPRGYQNMMQAFWWLRYAQVRPDLILDTGDFDGELKGHSGYAWGAEFAGDPALQAFYETATDRSLIGVSQVHDTGRALEEAPGLLDLVCCTHAAVAPAAPTSRIFPGRGSAVMRSGWNPQDTVISIRVGPWFNHEHHDQGSFQVAAYGEELIAEAGYTNYYQDPHYPDFFTQAPAHNTEVIDNEAFSQEDYDGRYWPAFQHFARFEHHTFSSGIAYLSADLAPAYGDGAQLSRLTREYLFLKPSILIVHDRVEAPTPHEYSWFLHIPPGAQTSLETAQAVIRRKTAFATISAAGDNTQWKLEIQPVPTIAYHDFDRIPVEPRETFRLDSIREKDSSFLVAMHFQKEGEELAPLQRISTGSGEGFADSGSSAKALFRSKPGQLIIGTLQTDGDVLAIESFNQGEEIFARNLSSIARGAQVLIASNPKIDVAIREATDLVEIHVFCPATTDLKVFANKPPKEVRQDQGLATTQLAGGLISFERLSKGDHVVTIRY